MVNRLEPINLVDFTGGLNLRKNQFQLNPNESPEMCNITVDPLGGIYTRKGWDRWSKNIVPEGDPWDPRRAFLYQLSDGTDITCVAANNKVYSTTTDTFTQLSGVVCNARPHMVDWAVYGDDLYLACGRDNVAYRRRLLTAPTALAAAAVGNWNDDYLNPVHNVFPKAELLEAHSGYLFVANTIEDAVTFPNRLRWSHPTSPDDWAEDDFIDIGIGGNRITALKSFEDHLLIFKPDSIWALYGFNADTWQLVQKSTTIGVLSPQAVTRSEQAVFFYSPSDRGGVFAYGGERPIEISEQLRHAHERIQAPELVWVGWLGRKLWVTIPWNYEGPTTDSAAVLVFDPSVGNGAWVYFSARSAQIGPIVGGSNIDTLAAPLAVLRNNDVPCVVQVDTHERAADEVWDVAVLGFTNSEIGGEESSGYIMTDDDADTGAELILGGQPGDEPFDTYYRTPWITADWPTRKKSFRRPDFICRYTGQDHELRIRSYRDYEELQAKRQYTLYVPAGGGTAVGESPGNQVAATWGYFRWNDGTLWNQPGDPPTTGGIKQGGSIRRGSSFGLCRALQLRVAGQTPGANWGIDAVVVKAVMRRFR